MSLRTKKSKNREEEIEITFIRTEEIPWPYSDEELKQINTSFSEKKKKRLTPCTSYNSLEVHYNSDSNTDLSSVSNFEEPMEDVYRKCCRTSSRYRMKKRTRIEPSILNHVLDALSVCFWKCSTGCQQIPDM